MAKHKHTVRNDRLHEQLAQATALGERKIPTAMTWPLAELKRELRIGAEKFEDAQQMLVDSFTEGEWRDDTATKAEPGKPAKQKFYPNPVYARNEDGTPKFKLDKKGEPTEEREIAQGKVQLTNAVQHARELRDLQRMECEISVPHVSWIQLEGKVPSLEFNIVEALMEYFDDPPKDAPAAPASRVTKKPTNGAQAPAGAAAT